MPDCGLGLLCVVDGRLVIGECAVNGKWSVRDLEKMETLSRLLRPREIVFAAFLDAMPEMQSEMIGQLRERLSDDHIEVTELLAHHLL